MKAEIFAKTAFWVSWALYSDSFYSTRCSLSVQMNSNITVSLLVSFSCFLYVSNKFRCITLWWKKVAFFWALTFFVCASGRVALRSTWYWQNFAGSCSCSPHRVHIHSSFGIRTGTEIYWWRCTHGSRVVCNGEGTCAFHYFYGWDWFNRVVTGRRQ